MRHFPVGLKTLKISILLHKEYYVPVVKDSMSKGQQTYYIEWRYTSFFNSINFIFTWIQRRIFYVFMALNFLLLLSYIACFFLFVTCFLFYFMRNLWENNNNTFMLILRKTIYDISFVGPFVSYCSEVLLYGFIEGKLCID